MKESEKKKQRVAELVQLHKALNLPKLYCFPDHETTKDWFANTAAVLKQLDEGDYQTFQKIQSEYYLGSRDYRIEMANEADRFVRQKVAEYKRYDFSYMDEDSPKQQDGHAGDGEILKLRPELHGISIDIKALYRKIMSGLKK